MNQTVIFGFAKKCLKMCWTVTLKYISAVIYQYHMLMLRLEQVRSVTNEHLRKNTSQIKAGTVFLCFAKTATWDKKK